MTISAADAVRNAHAWFETNSGWAPPDADTMAEWMADGVCRCPDECLVVPEGWCRHGLASWWLVLSAMDDTRHVKQSVPWLSRPHPSRLDPSRRDYAAVIQAHHQAVEAGDVGYVDPTTGLFVMTARYLWQRGQCCDRGCRHCPFLAR